MDIGGENIPNILFYRALIVLMAMAGGFIVIVRLFIPSLMLWVDVLGSSLAMMGLLTLTYTMYVFGYIEGLKDGKTESNKTESE